MGLLILAILLACSAHADDSSLYADYGDRVEHEAAWPATKESSVFSFANWLASHSVGQFLNVSLTTKLHIPVQVNVVLIGFQSDGDGQLDVSKEKLQQWFEHLAHRVKHVVVPVGEEPVTPNRKTEKACETNLEFDFQLRFIMADPLVTVALENVLLQNARKDQDDDTHYVDVFRVTSLLHHFLDSLNLTESSYTLFLLNPKGPVENMRYGYRAGLARWELDALREDDEWRRKMQVLVQHRQASKELLPTLAPKMPDLGADGLGRAWASWYLKHASEQTDDCRINGGDEDSATSLACLAHWTVKDLSLHGLTRHMARHGSRYHLRYLQAILRDEVPSDCLVDSWVSHERFAFLDVAAGPFEWGPIGSEAFGVRKALTVPRHDFETSKRQVTQETGNSPFEQLKFEYQVSCLSDRKPLQTCPGLLERLQNWNHVRDNKPEAVTDFTALDSWLSDVSSLSARAVRQLFVPGVPLFELPYSSRVHVVMYIVRTHSDYDPRGPEYFNWNEFSAELQRLAAPGQTFTMSVHQLSTGSERALSQAFHQSLHNVAAPTMDVESGQIKSARHVYVDSKLLRSKLHQRPPASTSFLVNERQVPVFLFSTNYRYPVMVDKTLQARALSDMVIVTQSNFQSYPSNVQCNGRPVMVDLRDPLREALRATAMHLAGLIQPHLSYSPSHQCITQDWLWSVGDSPMSDTSHGVHFGTIHSDMAARNYLLGALQKTLNSSNFILSQLFEAHTTPENYKMMEVLAEASVGHSLGNLWMLWDEILLLMGHLEWKKALELLPMLAETSKDLEASVRLTMDTVERYKCSDAVGESHYSWSGVLVGAMLLDVILVVSYVAWTKTRKQKVKIN